MASNTAECSVAEKAAPDKKVGLVNRLRRIPFMGIFFALLFAFFMSTAVTLVKLTNLHPIEVLMYRSLIQSIVFGIIAIFHRRPALGMPNERLHLLGRAVTGALNQGAWYISVRKVSLTDSAAVYYSAPVFVALLAYLFLNEPFGVFEGISVFFTVSGVIIVSKPSFIPIFGQTENETAFQGEHMEGLLYALGGALLFAMSNIFLRKLQKTSTEVINLWFSNCCVFLGIIYILYFNLYKNPNPFEWFIIALSGIFGVLGNICFVIAMKIEKAGPVSVAQTCNIVIVLIYQIAFFHEPISLNTLLGAFLIALSVALTGLKDVIKGTYFLTNLKNFATNTVSYKFDSKTLTSTSLPQEQKSVSITLPTNGKYSPFSKSVL